MIVGMVWPFRASYTIHHTPYTMHHTTHTIHHTCPCSCYHCLVDCGMLLPQPVNLVNALSCNVIVYYVLLLMTEC